VCDIYTEGFCDSDIYYLFYKFCYSWLLRVSCRDDLVDIINIRYDTLEEFNVNSKAGYSA